MSEEEQTPTTDSRPPGLPRLFQHNRREKWGLALVVERFDDRVLLQFQDGIRRTFHREYYAMLSPVDRPYDETLRVTESLRSMYSGNASQSTKPQRTPISLEEQIAYFIKKHETFDSPDYLAAHRGDGRKRPLRRHRDPTIVVAKEQLSVDALAEASPAEVHQAAVAVLRATDLASAKDRKALESIDPAHHEPFAAALRACLAGDVPPVESVEQLVATLERALGEPPSWQLVTSWLAFAQPEAHVAVRRDVFQRQAEWLAPGVTIPTRPTGPVYGRLLAMATLLFEELGRRELSPKDLLDVHEFVWLTLKPAARKEIEEGRGASPGAEAA